MFLRNYWYVAAWDDEVSRKPVARTFLNENVVLFRKQDGTPVALEDRCAHRRLPLSMGNLIDDTLQCVYHGLVYDCSGQCIHIPGQTEVPAGTGVKAYPVVERHRLIYIWMGDPKLADPSKITQFPRLDDPKWSITKVHLNIKANYLLVIDNLLDLSHVAYLHATTIGNEPVAEDAVVKILKKGNNVLTTREMINVPAARTYAQFGVSAQNIDRWQVSEFMPPAYFLINNGSERTNKNDVDPNRMETQGEWGFQVYHGITPETETSSHQFWAVAHENERVPIAMREEFYRQCHQVIHEDVAVYEAQQASLNSDTRGASAEDVHAAIAIQYDKGFLQARRVIDRLLVAEGGESAKSSDAPLL